MALYLGTSNYRECDYIDVAGPSPALIPGARFVILPQDDDEPDWDGEAIVRTVTHVRPYANGMHGASVYFAERGGAEWPEYGDLYAVPS